MEGPSCNLILLGIEIDSVARELRLPKSKLFRLKDIIFKWSKRKAATKNQLEVIIGLLNNSAKVVPAGRPFIRNLIDAKSPLREPSHFVRLNPGCKADVAWWEKVGMVFPRFFWSFYNFWLLWSLHFY